MYAESPIAICRGRMPAFTSRSPNSRSSPPYPKRSSKPFTRNTSSFQTDALCPFERGACRRHGIQNCRHAALRGEAEKFPAFPVALAISQLAFVARPLRISSTEICSLRFRGNFTLPPDSIRPGFAIRTCCGDEIAPGNAITVGKDQIITGNDKNGPIQNPALSKPVLECQT